MRKEAQGNQTDRSLCFQVQVNTSPYLPPSTANLPATYQPKGWQGQDPSDSPKAATEPRATSTCCQMTRPQENFAGAPARAPKHPARAEHQLRTPKRERPVRRKTTTEANASHHRPTLRHRDAIRRASAPSPQFQTDFPSHSPPNSASREGGRRTQESRRIRKRDGTQ